MQSDVVDLKDFYARPAGVVARRMIGRRLRALWPDLRGLSLVGVGYATPYLGLFREEARATLAFMPAAQGVVNWPSRGLSASALVDETDLPLPDSSVDRVVMVHALEGSEASRRLLRETWRVLAPGGRLMIAVANRRGMWARADATPFGHGRPYSRSQLVRLLRETLFTPSGWGEALFVPPVGVLYGSATAFERVGARLWPAFAGVILVEATKQLYAPVPAAKGRRVPVLAGPDLVPAAAGRVAALRSASSGRSPARP